MRIFKTKKIISIICTTLLFFGVLSSVGSYALDKSIVNVEPVINYSTKEITPNGNTVYDVINIKDFEKALNTKGIKEVKFLEFKSNEKQKSFNENNFYRGSTYSLANISMADSCLYKNPGKSTKVYNSKNYQVKTTKSVSITTTNSFSTSIGLSSDFLSSALGFEVGKSVTETDSVDVEVPAHGSVTIETYPRAHHYEFNIINSSGKNVGYGQANDICGVCFIIK